MSKQFIFSIYLKCYIRIFFVNAIIFCFKKADSVDGPSSANLIKKDDGFELEVKFWANEIGPNSPLKIKQQGADYSNLIKLIHVMYPVETSSADNKYMEHKITVPIPKTEIVSSKII